MPKISKMQVDTNTGELIQNKIMNHLTYRKQPGEVFTLPSMTVPGQSYSVPELIKRMESGQKMPMSFKPVYHGEDVYFPEVHTMELTDRMNYIQELQERTRDLAKRYKQEKSAEARLRLKNEIQAEINEQTEKTIAELKKKAETLETQP